jgi:hypothetical protein
MGTTDGRLCDGHKNLNESAHTGFLVGTGSVWASVQHRQNGVAQYTGHAVSS